MMRALLIILFLTTMMGTSVTASYADCIPGCPCDEPDNVMDVMKNHADANRVRDKAYSQQIIKQNDNALGMTCYDRALALSARLGDAFSDKIPTGSIPAQNGAVFGSSAFPNYGSDQLLAVALDSALTDSLQGHVANFLESLSAALGAAVMGYLQSFVTGAIQPILTTISGPLATLGGFVATLNGYMATLQTVIDLLGITFPAFIAAIITAINTAWSAINAFINGAMAAIMNVIGGIVQSILDAILGPLTSMLGASGPGGECSRLGQLWGNGFIPPLFPAFRSLVGSSSEPGAPYFSFADLASGSVVGGGTDLMREILNVNNSPILNNALNDITNKLNAPGVLPNWTVPPLIPPNSTTAAIIGAM